MILNLHRVLFLPVFGQGPIPGPLIFIFYMNDSVDIQDVITYIMSLIYEYFVEESHLRGVT